MERSDGRTGAVVGAGVMCGVVWCGIWLSRHEWISSLCSCTLFCACPDALKVSFAVVSGPMFFCGMRVSSYIGVWQVVGA